MTTVGQIINAVADFAPLSLQESWDNSGVQVGATDIACTGVMLCVDVTPDVIAEAAARGCNLVIAHHPLLFRGLKQIVPGNNIVQQAVIDAIRGGITVYSSHTALDSAPGGISHRMAAMLGARVTRVLAPAPDSASAGLGVVAVFDKPLAAADFIGRVKGAFSSPVVRCSAWPADDISTIALCGGSGGEFIAAAIAAGAQAYLSSDIRYHDFVDYGKQTFLCDIGHFEAESCAKQIFYELISENFPNFAVYKSESETNSIKYL